jgi:hypothetical protein
MTERKTLLPFTALQGRTITKVKQRSAYLALHLDGGNDAVVACLDHYDAVDVSRLDQSDIAILKLEKENP